MNFTITLCTGKEFSQKDLYSEEGQELLRDAYVKQQCRRAICNCNPKEKLQLIIAYRRTTNHFELRKSPHQDYDLHEEGCRFRVPPKTSYPGVKSKHINLALPTHEHEKISDHDHLEKILKNLWKILEKNLHGESEKHLKKYEKFGIPWYEVKDNLIELSEAITINKNIKLSEILMVVKPVKKDELYELKVDQNRATILIGEIFESFCFQDKEGKENILVKLKGTTTPIYINERHNMNIKEKNKSLILSRGFKDKRIIVALIVLPSKTGKSIQGYAVAPLLVSKENFKMES